MKLNVPTDCDNAPKRRLIKDFIIALYKNEFETIANGIEDEFEFRIIGHKTISNKEELRKYLVKNVEALELTLDEVLSHGKFGACNGTYKTKKEEIFFAYFFEFKSAGKYTIKIISEYKIANQI